MLGPPYERQTINLGTDDEGPVVATLVRRRAERPSGRAVLYVHGFVDYFFQTHLADFFAERGWDFYALDLRKYGRSLLPGQTRTSAATSATTSPSWTPPPRSSAPTTGTTPCWRWATPPAA